MQSRPRRPTGLLRWVGTAGPSRSATSSPRPRDSTQDAPHAEISRAGHHAVSRDMRDPAPVRARSSPRLWHPTAAVSATHCTCAHLSRCWHTPDGGPTAPPGLPAGGPEHPPEGKTRTSPQVTASPALRSRPLWTTGRWRTPDVGTTAPAQTMSGVLGARQRGASGSSHRGTSSPRNGGPQVPLEKGEDAQQRGDHLTWGDHLTCAEPSPVDNPP